MSEDAGKWYKLEVQLSIYAFQILRSNYTHVKT